MGVSNTDPCVSNTHPGVSNTHPGVHGEDLCALPVERDGGGRDSDASLTLLVHEVHHCIALVYLGVFVFVSFVFLLSFHLFCLGFGFLVEGGGFRAFGSAS